MVKGIETFKRYFSEYESGYVIIGGTACEIIERNAGQNPRATKDVDMILIIEALSPEFVKRFWQFIVDGQYKTKERGSGKSELFRFMKPEQHNFPFQIELFARKPDILTIIEGALLTPIPLNEELSSLSAILLNNDYYNFTIEHSCIAEGIRIANVESLICLKAKAFLDLTNRKKTGEKIDENNIRKHFNDIFRLAVILKETDSYIVPKGIRDDMITFCIYAKSNLPDRNLFKSAGIGYIDAGEVFERLCLTFEIEV